MDVDALRTWGIVVGGALMAGALALSAPEPPAGAAAQAPLEAAPPARTEPLAFIVRFRGAGPIARAQARAGRGEFEQAGRQVQIQLQRQRDFAGLCFDRFTVGGAEIVLRTCAAIPANERDVAQAQWLARLRAMRAVAYVDANVTVAPEQAG
jgi:hypothetical protein